MIDLEGWQRNFLGLATSQGFSVYVETKVRLDPSLLLGRQETPLLLYPFREGVSSSIPDWSCEMVHLLLKLGANPNQLWQGNTPWQHALTKMHQHIDEGSTPVYAAICQLMLRYGASPYTTCVKNHRVPTKLRVGKNKYSVESVVSQVFGKLLPLEAAEI